jgi:hypothetical protein
MTQEQNTLFSEGVDRYEHKKYSQAKLLFGELANQHDRRAAPWLKKVDRAITRELLRSREDEERERTAFIADQLKAQHQLVIIQERERQRQKKLTEALERQKRLYEDTHLLQLRKEEMMKAQVFERQRQEEKRRQLEKENEKQQESLRFHKIEIPAKPKPVVAAPAADAPKAVLPTVMPPKQAEAQIDFSNKRKAFLDTQYKKEQREQARQAELKRREESAHQRAHEREEKIKQEKTARQEAKHNQELQRQERQRQAQLEARREAVRRQLEDGVEDMYQEALGLYKKGNYTAAADKFKDVQDIIPGYKRAAEYMDKARLKPSTVNPQAVNISSDTSVMHASPSVSRQDDVSKALDLFDPNVK